MRCSGGTRVRASPTRCLTRRQLLTASIGAALAGWRGAAGCGTGEAEEPLVDVRTGMFGALLEASYAGPLGIIRARVTRSTAGAAAQAAIDILQGSTVLATVSASAPLQVVPRTLGAASLAIRAGPANYRLRWDASTLAVESGVLPTTGAAVVEVQADSRIWRGLFDFETWSLRDPWDAPDLETFLPVDVRRPAEPFAAVFRSVILGNESRSAGAFAPTAGQRPAVLAGTAGAPCATACWTAPGGAVAAACPEPSGIVCILATAACGTAASVAYATCTR